MRTVKKKTHRWVNVVEASKSEKNSNRWAYNLNMARLSSEQNTNINLPLVLQAGISSLIRCFAGHVPV